MSTGRKRKTPSSTDKSETRPAAAAAAASAETLAATEQPQAHQRDLQTQLEQFQAGHKKQLEAMEQMQADYKAHLGTMKQFEAEHKKHLVAVENINKLRIQELEKEMLANIRMERQEAQQKERIRKLEEEKQRLTEENYRLQKQAADAAQLRQDKIALTKATEHMRDAYDDIRTKWAVEQQSFLAAHAENSKTIASLQTRATALETISHQKDIRIRELEAANAALKVAQQAHADAKSHHTTARTIGLLSAAAEAGGLTAVRDELTQDQTDTIERFDFNILASPRPAAAAAAAAAAETDPDMYRPYGP